jgi:ketosteroid isomerase-like protein
MHEERQQRTVDAYFDGINGDRFEDVAALFTDDAQLHAPGVPPRTGPAEIAPYFAAALAAYPKHFDDPVRVVHAPGTTTVEIHYTGELANGNPMVFDAIDVFDFDDEGRITKLQTVYDSHLVRSRLAKARGGDHRSILLTQIDHVEGEEAQFHAWFAQHAEEVLAVPGVKDVQRYEASAARGPGQPEPLRQWVCVYHLAGDVQAVLDELVRRRTAGEWAPRVSVVEDTIHLAAFDPVRTDGSPIGAA